MKRIIILMITLFLLVSFSLIAETVVVNEKFYSLSGTTPAEGDWVIKGGRLYQMDTEAGMAKLNVRAPQSGVMQYEFNVKYADGGLDGHAGFGVHILVDRAHNGKSWGNGKSHLLWLNYDENTNDREHYGYRAQVYKSENHSKMYLMDNYNLKIPTSYLKREYANYDIPVKIVVNTNTGEIRVYNPARERYYYYFYLPGLSRGSYFSLRTNSLSCSFDNLKITKLQ